MAEIGRILTAMVTPMRDDGSVELIEDRQKAASRGAMAGVRLLQELGDVRLRLEDVAVCVKVTLGRHGMPPYVEPDG